MLNAHNNIKFMPSEAIVLASGVTILLLAILFPPWIRPVVISGTPSYVRCWVGTNPNYYGDPGFVMARDELIFECALVFLVMTVLTICIRFGRRFRGGRRDQP